MITTVGCAASGAATVVAGLRVAASTTTCLEIARWGEFERRKAISGPFAGVSEERPQVPWHAKHEYYRTKRRN